VRVNTKVAWSIETGEILERESFEYNGPVESCDPATALLIATIASASVGAAGVGLSIDQAVNAPGTPKISGTPSPLTGQQNAQQASAVGQQLPNLQSLTGGSLNPEYSAQFGATQAGVGNDPRATGNIQEAINQYFGLTAPGQTGLTPSGSGPSGGPGITSLTGSQPPSPATIGGGGGGIMDLLKGGGGAGIQGWIQQQLQGNNFQGLQQG
jgi:hypothetical protein